MVLQRLSNTSPLKCPPLLRSVELGSDHNYDYSWLPPQPLFQLGAPHNTEADIFDIYLPCIPDLLSGFQQLRSLRISPVFIGYEEYSDADTTYNEFRDALMALPFSNHLELPILNKIFVKRHLACQWSCQLPFLLLEATRAALSDIINSIHATCLVTLYLKGCDTDGGDPTVDNPLNLPSLH